MHIDAIHLKNFKSIHDTTIKLGTINVLIGANGAGKSNFISYFKFLKSLMSGKLQGYTAQKGGADNILHFGVKESSFLSTKIDFNNNNNTNSYECLLKPTQEDSFFFEEEFVYYHTFYHALPHYSGSMETQIDEQIKRDKEHRGYNATACSFLNCSGSFHNLIFYD